MRNIAVFFGGESVEHDISVITGVIVMNSIDKSGDVSIPVFVGRDGKWYTGQILKDIDFYKALDLKKLKRVSMVFGDNTLYYFRGKRLKEFCTLSSAINCMHGGVGEDGSMMGCLNVLGIPTASPNVLSSSAFMDKAMTKILLKGIKVDTLKCVVLDNDKELENVEKAFFYPVIVKPISLGSSVGIKVARDRKELKDGVLFALRYANKVVVEPFLKNVMEINCAVYKDRGGVVVSECERPIKKNTLLDFDDKYMAGDREFPAKIPDKIRDKIRKIAQKIYTCFDMQGIIRIDFMVDNEKVLVNEVNTVPGSLAYYLFADSSEEFSAILKRLTDLAITLQAKDKTLVKRFSSSVLNIKGAKGSKRL